MWGDNLKIINRDFYMDDTLAVSKNLIGKNIVHEINGNRIIGKIVEVEAYMGPYDKAAHSYNNKVSDRNRIMYGPGGFAYVYLIYGMYYCFNIVTKEENKPEAILIRGVEPIEGLDEMAKRRYSLRYDELTKPQKRNLTNGPGKLCIALGIDRSLNGYDLTKPPLYIADPSDDIHYSIKTSKRINIDYAEEAVDYPWRFYAEGNPYVSPVKVKD